MSTIKRLAKIKPRFTVRRAVIEYLDRIQRWGHDAAPEPVLAQMKSGMEDRLGPEFTAREYERDEHEFFFLVVLYAFTHASVIDEFSWRLPLNSFANAHDGRNRVSRARLSLVDRANGLIVSLATLDRVQEKYLGTRVLPSHLRALLDPGRPSVAERGAPNHDSRSIANEFDAQAQARVETLTSWARAAASIANCRRAAHWLEQANQRVGERFQDRLLAGPSPPEPARSDWASGKGLLFPKGTAGLEARSDPRDRTVKGVRKLLERFRESTIVEIVGCYVRTQTTSFADPQAYVRGLAAHSLVAGPIRDEHCDLVHELSIQDDRDYLSKARYYDLELSSDHVRNVRALDPESTLTLVPCPRRAAAEFLGWLFQFPGAGPNPIEASFTQMREFLESQFRSHVVAKLLREAEQETFFKIELAASLMTSLVEEVSTTLDLLAAACSTEPAPDVLVALFARLEEQHERLSIVAAEVQILAEEFQGRLVFPDHLRCVLKFHESFEVGSDSQVSERYDAIQAMDSATSKAAARSKIHDFALVAHANADVSTYYSSVLLFAQAHAGLMERLRDWSTWLKCPGPQEIHSVGASHVRADQHQQLKQDY